jgi:hypothetical protein
MPPPTNRGAALSSSVPGGVSIVCLHTVPALLPQFQALPAPALHLVDELLLHSIAKRLSSREEHLARLLAHRDAAAAVGARVFFVTCSTLSPLVAELPSKDCLATVAIDAPMIEAAAARPGLLAVVATNPAALKPCVAMLAAAGRAVTGPAVDLPEAFAAFRAGDFALHDRILLEALAGIDSDTIVLAQASMARILPLAPKELRERLLTSPQTAIAKVEQILAA